MKTLKFGKYDIEVFNDSAYTIGSSDNKNYYDFVYHDDESLMYSSSMHGVILYENGQIIKSAIVCAVGGATGIYENSVIIVKDNILICCANKLYCLCLPNLTLNWVAQPDFATCFGVYAADNGLFTHGEVEISRLDLKGNIIWQEMLSDIIVNVDNDKDCFILHEDHIELQDFNSNKYWLNFNGKFLSKEK